MARAPGDSSRPALIYPWQWVCFASVLFVPLLLILPHVPVQPAMRASIACLAACLFGASVGLVELLARYRDNPLAAVRTVWGLLYITINAVVATAVFMLLFTQRLPMPVNLFAEAHLALNAAFIGGFGGMAVLRGSIANIRFRERTFQAGPALVLQVILDALDRACDRERGRRRSEIVQDVMEGVVYSRARALLPQVAMTVLQNLTLEEKSAFVAEVENIERDTNRTDTSRLHELGLLLMNVVGEELLEQLVRSMGERIRGPAPDDKTMPVFERAGMLEVADLSGLLGLCRALSARRDLDPDPKGDTWHALLRGTPALYAGGSPPRDKERVLMTLAVMREHFGAETVHMAIGLLLTAEPAGHGNPPEPDQPEPPPPDPTAATPGEMPGPEQPAAGVANPAEAPPLRADAAAPEALADAGAPGEGAGPVPPTAGASIAESQQPDGRTPAGGSPAPPTPEPAPAAPPDNPPPLTPEAPSPNPP